MRGRRAGARARRSGRRTSAWPGTPSRRSHDQPCAGARDEGGSALVELVWLGILLLVPLVWIVLSVFEVQRGAFAVTGAARAAGRAYALAPDDATGRARAEAAARQALADQGIAGAPVERRITCTPYPTTATAAPRSSPSWSHRGSTCRCCPTCSAAGRRASRSTPPTRCRSGSTSRWPPMAERRRTAPRRAGQTTVLIIGFAVVLLMAVAVVVDASAAYLQRQGARQPRRRRRAGRRRCRGVGGGRLHRRHRRGAAASCSSTQRAPGWTTTSPAPARTPTTPACQVAVNVDPATRTVTVRLRAPLDLPLTVPGSPERATIGATGSAIVSPER